MTVTTVISVNVPYTTLTDTAEGVTDVVSAAPAPATVISPLGQPGLRGAGVPAGGTTGQVLGKLSSTDLDTGWVAQTGGGSGAVASVFGRTGVVAAQSGDYTAGQVGADVSGAAATAQAAAIAAAATDATTKANAAVTTAEAYADTGDALALKKASNLSDLANTTTARTNLGLGSAATHPSTDFDSSGAAAAAQAASQPLDADLTTIAALDASTAGAMATDGSGWVRKTYAQLKMALGLVKADVGLGNVDNTSDANKPVSTAQAAADALALPLTGGTMSGAIAMGSHKVTGLTNGSAASDAAAFGQIPTALPPNGTASGDLSGTYPSPNVAKLNGTALSGLATGLLKNTTTTGVPSIAAAADVPTAAAGSTGPLSATDATTTNSRTPTTHAASHASGGSDPVTLAESQVTNLTTDLAAKAPLASPTFTGSPAAPTQTAGDNSTKLATTAFVAAVATRTLHLPSGALSATFDRGPASTAAQAILTSGTLWMVGLDLTAGQVVTSVSFRTGATGASSPTHQFFGIADSTRAVQRWTSDDTTTAWGATATKTLNLTSTYTVPTTGFYYLLMLVTASVMPQPVCVTANTNINGIAPITNGPTTDTGLTTPPALPFTAGAVTVTASTPYGWVS